MANMSQMLNVLGNEDSDNGIKHRLKQSSSKTQNITKYAIFYSSVIVTVISGEFHSIHSFIVFRH